MRVPDAELYAIDVSFQQLKDKNELKYLNKLPTSFHLPSEAVDRLRAAAGKIILESPEFQRLRNDVGVTIVPDYGGPCWAQQRPLRPILATWRRALQSDNLSEVRGIEQQRHRCVEAAASSASKRATSGLSISSTPNRRPRLINGTTISERDAASQAMCPGNSFTSGTTIVSRRAAAVPHTPLPSAMRTQATFP